MGVGSPWVRRGDRGPSGESRWAPRPESRPPGWRRPARVTRDGLDRHLGHDSPGGSWSLPSYETMIRPGRPLRAASQEAYQVSEGPSAPFIETNGSCGATGTYLNRLLAAEWLNST